MANLNASFNAEEEANIQHLLTDDLCSRKVTSRGIDYQKQRFVHLANKIFKFNGWSYSVNKENIDFVEYNDNTYKVGVCAWVKVLLKDGSFREDVGYGFYESVLKGNAIQNARKLAGADALMETLKGLGNAFSYLSADEFMPYQVNNSPDVQGESSSEAQTDTHGPGKEVERPPLTRRRGRKRKTDLLSSSFERKIQTTSVSNECEELSENVTVQSSHVQAMPYHNRLSLTNNSSQAYEESKDNDMKHHSSATSVFQSTGAKDEDRSELPNSYRGFKRIPIRGRRGRRRKRGRPALSAFYRRKREPYIPQEPGKVDEDTAIPCTRVEIASDCQEIPTDSQGEELQNELDAGNGSTSQQRDGSPASGSTNTADESPTDTSYVAMMSTNWNHEVSTCNSQTSDVESMCNAIRTDSSVQSHVVKLQRIDFTCMEEQNISPYVLISSPTSVPYGTCKTEALDLSSSSAPSSHVGNHVKHKAASKKVSSTSKNDIL